MAQYLPDDVYYLGRVFYKNLPDVNQTIIAPAETQPNVLNKNFIIFNNTGAVTVTNFLKGTEYQTIRIKGDGFTTVSHNANIKTNIGANKLLNADRIYSFTMVDDVWYEE